MKKQHTTTLNFTASKTEFFQKFQRRVKKVLSHSAAKNAKFTLRTQSPEKSVFFASFAASLRSLRLKR